MPGQHGRSLLERQGRSRQQAGVEALIKIARVRHPAAGFVETGLWRVADALTMPIPAAAAQPGKFDRLRSPWLLPGILLVQAALSVRLVWANTAFQDESLYLTAGHLELAHWLHGASVPAFATLFSGAPVIYPPLAAIANDIGGLAAARLLSLAFMLAATLLLYATAKRLYGKGPALAAAALFGTFGMASQLGAFATYDAMALCLIALGAWLTVRATGRFSELILLLAAGSLALADATKYASILWNPVVVLLALLAPSQAPRFRRFCQGIRLAAYVTLIDSGALYTGGRQFFLGIDSTTLQRHVLSATPPLKIVDVAWGWLALLLLLGVMGVLLIWLDQRKATVLPIALFAAALLAPAEQARISEVTSLHKHIVFGAWFICIVAGYAITRISRLDGQLSHGVIIGSVLIAAFAATGFSQANAVTRSWPPVSKVMPALGSTLEKAGCPCLIFQQSAAHYYLPNSDLSGLVYGSHSFSYQDSSSARPQSGPPAMAEAIRHDYFGTVEVDGSRGAAIYRLLTRGLRRSGQYRLIASEPWSSYPRAPSQVWERIAGSAR
ncbi:MAG TPA: glycosyltransferase family 39 protein [Streptosporangiaceae bacterium]|nr:glycosyltransferase family 39 protein [Streptosporangiaceae bacterium]